MGGGFVPEEDLNLKGIKKYYNSYTLRGRFNWVVTTYGTLFGGFILYKMIKFFKKDSPSTSKSKPKESKPRPREDPHCQ